MSRKLDEELARAVAETSDEDAAAAKPAKSREAVAASAAEEGGPDVGREVAPARRAPVAVHSSEARGSSKSVGLLVGLLTVGGALVLLFLFGFKKAAIYAIQVSDIHVQSEKLAGRKVRVEGELVPGTLAKRDQPCEYRFTMHGAGADKGKTLDVRYPQCVVPDTFRDMPGGGVQVTVEGKLAKEGHFDATLVMAKCTSKYDPATHEMKGGGEPKAMPDPSEPIR